MPNIVWFSNGLKVVWFLHGPNIVWFWKGGRSHGFSIGQTSYGFSRARKPYGFERVRHRMVSMGQTSYGLELATDRMVFQRAKHLMVSQQAINRMVVRGLNIGLCCNGQQIMYMCCCLLFPCRCLIFRGHCGVVFEKQHEEHFIVGNVGNDWFWCVRIWKTRFWNCRSFEMLRITKKRHRVICVVLWSFTQMLICVLFRVVWQTRVRHLQLVCVVEVLESEVVFVYANGLKMFGNFKYCAYSTTDEYWHLLFVRLCNF